MLRINNQPYINLDTFLPIDSMPPITKAIGDSYDLIKQNTWQKTTFLDGSTSNCNWFSKKKRSLNNSDFFKIEIENKTVSPMWILDLSNDKNISSLNLYDSIKNSPSEWKNISFREDLPASWNPFIVWLNQLNCFNFIGRTSLLLTRPGIAPHYHRDIGVSDESYVPYAHRQEFIWLKITDEKVFFILDENRKPIAVKSRSAFFNHHNWHGSHTPLPFWAFSLKVEGVFKDTFRTRLGLSQTELYA